MDGSYPRGLDGIGDLLDDADLVAFLKQPFVVTGRYDIFPIMPTIMMLARLSGAPFDTFVRETSAAQPGTMRIRNRGARGVPDRVARFNAQIYDFGKFEAQCSTPNA